MCPTGSKIACSCLLVACMLSMKSMLVLWGGVQGFGGRVKALTAQEVVGRDCTAQTVQVEIFRCSFRNWFNSLNNAPEALQLGDLGCRVLGVRVEGVRFRAQD